MMQITYHGHSCVQVQHDGVSVIIDPFVTGNPAAKTKLADIHVHYIFLTHGHEDHIADAVELARQCNAPIVANVELATYLSWQGAPSVIGMNTGGSYTLDFGKVRWTQALHSSSVTLAEEKQILYLGNPQGLLLTIGGAVLYHAGDTDLFYDMKLIGERNTIDVAFLPIGDHFTMGPEDAVVAAEWLRAKSVIPIHYNTFPPIRQDGQKFVNQLRERGIDGRLVQPGETVTWPFK